MSLRDLFPDPSHLDPDALTEPPDELPADPEVPVDCLGCGVCESCIDRSISAAEEAADGPGPDYPALKITVGVHPPGSDERPFSYRDIPEEFWSPGPDDFRGEEPEWSDGPDAIRATVTVVAKLKPLPDPADVADWEGEILDGPPPLSAMEGQEYQLGPMPAELEEVMIGCQCPGCPGKANPGGLLCQPCRDGIDAGRVAHPHGAGRKSHLPDVAELIGRSEALRDAGMAQVEEAAGDDWNTRARAWLKTYLEANREYNPDLVNGTGPKPREARAWGPVTLKAIREGWIVRTGYAPRVNGRCAPGPVYKSLIFKGK